jgi:hypothetical protein
MRTLSICRINPQSAQNETPAQPPLPSQQNRGFSVTQKITTHKQKLSTKNLKKNRIFIRKTMKKSSIPFARARELPSPRGIINIIDWRAAAVREFYSRRRPKILESRPCRAG